MTYLVRNSLYFLLTSNLPDNIICLYSKITISQQILKNIESKKLESYETYITVLNLTAIMLHNQIRLLESNHYFI